MGFLFSPGNVAQSARLATTSNIADLAAGAPNSVDGQTPVVDDVILVQEQDTGAQDGPYKVVTVGTGVNGVWTRVLLLTGVTVETVFVKVAEGTLYAGRMFYSSNPAPIVIGTGSPVFRAIATETPGAADDFGAAGIKADVVRPSTAGTLLDVGSADKTAGGATSGTEAVELRSGTRTKSDTNAGVPASGAVTAGSGDTNVTAAATAGVSGVSNFRSGNTDSNHAGGTGGASGATRHGSGDAASTLGTSGNTGDSTYAPGNSADGTGGDAIHRGGNGVTPGKFRLQDAADPTKQVVHNVTGVATGTTRTITYGDADLNLGTQATALAAVIAESAASTVVVAAIVAENTDGHVLINILSGIADGGVWTRTNTSGGLGSSALTAAIAEVSDWIPIIIPARTTASKGRKPSGLRVNYQVGTAALTDVRFEVWTETEGADNAARSCAVRFGQSDAHYDAAHDTAAERGDSTAAPELHLAIVTDPAPAYLAAGTSLKLRAYVSGTATGAFSLTRAELMFAETLVDAA